MKLLRLSLGTHIASSSSLLWPEEEEEDDAPGSSCLRGATRPGSFSAEEEFWLSPVE